MNIKFKTIKFFSNKINYNNTIKANLFNKF